MSQTHVIKRVPLGVYIREDLKKRLGKKAIDLDKPMYLIVEEAIEKYLEELEG